MSTDSLSDLLERMGFSDKEIDMYLALLEHGEAKAAPSRTRRASPSGTSTA